VVVTPRLDLLSTDAVHAWCDGWLAGRYSQPQGLGQAEQPPALHVLINNAGANFMGLEPFFTPQGVAGLPQVWASLTFVVTFCCRSVLLSPFGAVSRPRLEFNIVSDVDVRGYVLHERQVVNHACPVANHAPVPQQ
jgi:hypothetical protein